MLTAQMYGADGCRCGYGLGDLSGVDVQGLQNTLALIAQQKGKTKYNPYRNDGTMNMGTVIALFNVATDLSINIPVISTVLSTVRSIKSGISSVPGVEYLLDPGKVDGIITAARAVASVLYKSALPYFDKVEVVKNFVRDNSKEINAGLAIALAAGAAAPSTTPPVTVPSAPPVTTVGPVLMVVRPTIAPSAGAPAPAPAAAYPPGTIAAWSVKLGRWRVAVPVATSGGLGVADMDGCCIYGDCGLGQAYAEDMSANVIRLTDPVTLPPGAKQVAEGELEDKTGKKPIYKKWWFWTAVGGVVAAGGGTYYFIRRKKAKKAV